MVLAAARRAAVRRVAVQDRRSVLAEPQGVPPVAMTAVRMQRAGLVVPAVLVRRTVVAMAVLAAGKMTAMVMRIAANAAALTARRRRMAAAVAVAAAVIPVHRARMSMAAVAVRQLQPAMAAMAHLRVLTLVKSQAPHFCRRFPAAMA